MSPFLVALVTIATVSSATWAICGEISRAKREVLEAIKNRDSFSAR